MLVFIPSLGAFVTPAILGGGKSLMIGNVISNQFLAAHDWPFGSALSTLMMVLDAVRHAALLPLDGSARPRTTPRAELSTPRDASQKTPAGARLGPWALVI